MPDSCTTSPVETQMGGCLLPARWREPFLLSPWALHVFFLAYAINCIVFYQDRIDLDITQFLNSSLLARGVFFIVHGRGFIQVPPQILPWLAIQVGLPLKGVALAYSLGFCVYHYLIALLLYWGFRRRDLATLMVFIILVYLVHNNFYIYADGMHIIPWALCMLAVLQQPVRGLLGRVLVALGAALFAVITASSHPFGMPLCLALAGYALFCSAQRLRLLPTLATVVVALAAYHIWHRSHMDSYDRAAMEMVGLATLRQNGLYFIRYFVFAHSGAIVCMALLVGLGLFHASRRGAYWFSALCILGYAALISTYVPRFTHLYYWHCMLPMYAILAAPFFDTHSTTPGTRTAARFIFAAALVWAVVGSAADLTALRARSVFQANLISALPADKNGDRLYILEDGQLSRDYLSSFLPQYFSEETCLRNAYTDTATTTVLMARSRHEKGNWMLSQVWIKQPSSYLPGFPLKKEAFTPAIVPSPAATIFGQATQVSLDYPERPTRVRVVDGWLCNYQRPPKMVYSVPITVTNKGDKPFPARSTEGKGVLFGYYWHRDGKIVHEDLKAEWLPVNVTSSFQHVLNVQWAGVPDDARLGVDLFLNGRPLLHPDVYYSLIPSGESVVRKTSESVIEMQAGFYNVEKSGVWLARLARFAFIRDLRQFSFALLPPPNTDAAHPADVEVRCEATGVVVAHRFTDRTPFTVTVTAPRAGQAVLITSSREYCPAREGTSADTRNLAVKLYEIKAVAP